MPTALQFWSYILFFSSSVCGPAGEYKDFINFIESKEEFEDIPNPLWPTLVKIFWALGRSH